MSIEEPERRVVESQRAGTVVEAPGQLRLSSREMRQTAVNDCMHDDGSSEMEGNLFKRLPG